MAKRKCSIEGCTNPAIARGWCGTHYSRWQRTGDPGTVESRYRPRVGDCGVTECEGTIYAKGLCKMHYARQHRGAPLTAPKRKPRTGECEAPDCDRAVYAQGLCRNHYRSLRVYGDISHVAVPVEGCAVDACDKEHYALGMCEQHYARFKRTGDPIKGLHGNNKGGYVNEQGYKVLSVNGHPVLEHRLVMERTLGRDLRPNENVHHINGRRADNRPENLELWVKAQPCGQRVEDLVAFASAVLKDYGAEALREKRRRKTL